MFLCLRTYRGASYGRWRLVQQEAVHHLVIPKDMEGLDVLISFSFSRGLG